MQIEQKNRLIQIANEYRNQREKETGYYIIISDSEVVGWKKEVDNPSAWIPKTILVGKDETIYEAQGGNGYDGALEWVEI